MQSVESRIAAGRERAIKTLSRNTRGAGYVRHALRFRYRTQRLKIDAGIVLFRGSVQVLDRELRIAAQLLQEARAMRDGQCLAPGLGFRPLYSCHSSMAL